MKRCPFCKSEAITIDDISDQYFDFVPPKYRALCQDCGVVGMDYLTYEQAEAAWDNRPIEDELEKLVLTINRYGKNLTLRDHERIQEIANRHPEFVKLLV